MKKADRARLERAIEQIGSGNILMLLDEPDGRTQLLAWLTELRDLSDRVEARAHADNLRTLQDFYGLTEDEAERVLAHMPFSTEEGECRKCKGRGKVEVFVRSTCFGQQTEDEDCLLCGGLGIDKKRIIVPEA